MKKPSGFIKKGVEPEIHYQLGALTVKSRVVHKSEITAEMVEANWNGDKAETLDFIGNCDFAAYRAPVLTDANEILPPGAYRFYARNPYTSEPSRLVPIAMRNADTYLQLSQMDAITHDMATFMASQQLYKDLGFLYRRGYLLYGAPGNGKTALIRELTNTIKVPAQVIWFKEIPDERFVIALNALPTLKICIFEEISADENTSDVDVRGLLEFLDGEHTLENCIVIATTNSPENLKANLANRPSRFDVVCEIGPPSEELAYSVLSQMLHRLVSQTEIQYKALSFAQLKEVVLLHKLHGLTLAEAQDRLIEHTDTFKRGFINKKGRLGL